MQFAKIAISILNETSNIILRHGQGITGAAYGTYRKVMDPKNAMVSATLKKLRHS